MLLFGNKKEQGNVYTEALGSSPLSFLPAPPAGTTLPKNLVLPNAARGEYRAVNAPTTSSTWLLVGAVGNHSCSLNPWAGNSGACAQRGLPAQYSNWVFIQVLLAAWASQFFSCFWAPLSNKLYVLKMCVCVCIYAHIMLYMYTNIYTSVHNDRMY